MVHPHCVVLSHVWRVFLSMECRVFMKSGISMVILRGRSFAQPYGLGERCDTGRLPARA